MNEPFAFYEKTAEYVKQRAPFVPEIALILGTGLGPLAGQIENPVTLDYREIPNFLVSTAPDHAGKLIFGTLEGKKLVCMSGRFHTYEGYDFEQLSIPVRLFKLLGVKQVIVTNAAGGVNEGYRPGDIMVISDHIKLNGASPMRARVRRRAADRGRRGPDRLPYLPARRILPVPYILFKFYNDQVLHFAYPPYFTITDMFYPTTASHLLQPKYSCKIISTLSAFRGHCFVS